MANMDGTRAQLWKRHLAWSVLVMLTAAATGCGYPELHRLESTDAGKPFCVGRFVAVCRLATPQNLTLSAAETINTDTDPRCALQDQGAGVPQLCVVAGNDITVSAQIIAIGSHPLVLAAFNDLNVTAGGSLILSSPSGQTPGGGANDPACHPSTAAAASINNNHSTGGGAGGSLGGSGGIGGTGDSGYELGGTSGAPIAPITWVVGGCKGSKGGDVGQTAAGDLPERGRTKAADFDRE